MAKEHRAGVYVRQPGGYRAFMPAPLPPRPPVRLDGALQARLSAADRALGRLDGAVGTLPDADLFIRMYARKEAVLSSRIEGTQSTLRDLLAAEAGRFAPGRADDTKEVANYVTAMNYGLERLGSLPLSARLIREIHERLMRGVRGDSAAPGELRASQNWIGPAGSSPSDAVFVPPPHQEVPRLLGELEKFLHRRDNLPDLIRIGLAHPQFEAIHPFLDGNGRAGRLLIVFQLCERKILAMPVLYISQFFMRHRQEYYDRLQGVHDRGEWEDWLAFFLRGVETVGNDAAATVRRILELREKRRAAAAGGLGRAAASGLRLLEELYRRPVVDISAVRDITGLGYPAANRVVARMAGLGILEEATGHRRNRMFAYRDYIRLFSDDED